MSWNICFAASLLFVAVAAFLCIYVWGKHKDGRILNPFNIAFAGIFLAVFTGLIPTFIPLLEEETAFLLKLLLFDILQTIQVFTINVGADLILDNINSGTTAISGIYSSYMTMLFFAAPMMTFGFLVSLFRSMLTDISYKIHYFSDVYIFSSLNDKSLMLAQSIRENHGKALIVFTDTDKDNEENSENIEASKELRALIFSNDIASANFTSHCKKARMVFFSSGENESENLISALKILEKYNNRKNTELYVFSTGTEGELLLANAKKGEIKVRRINEVRSLIYNFLYEEGVRIFENAIGEAGKEKKAVHAVILGLGDYGTQMLKALTWYCQMDGYSINIHAFDKDELAEDRFAALCPELMSEKYNGVTVEGESEYSVHIHSGVDVSTKSFADCIADLPGISFVFVCLGDDARNIKYSADMRMLCERRGCKPVIKTVVYSSDEKSALEGITNYRGQPYGIEAIGDFSSIYSEEILLGSELERLALERHLKWGKEEDFWQYEYNYRSSMASAIHLKARTECGIKGADKAENQLTQQERDCIEVLEHKRWNTYMRSEGYVYSGSPDKSSRNDLAKMHHDLVDFASLSEEDKRKDSSVGTV